MLQAELLDAIEHAPWFKETTKPYLIVDGDMCINAVNDPYLEATGHSRGNLVGEDVFEVFPVPPGNPCAEAAALLAESFDFVFSKGVRHWMGIQRLDVPDARTPGAFVKKVWTPVNTPIWTDHTTVAILHHVEDVSVVFDVEDSAHRLSSIARTARSLASHFTTLSPEAIECVLATSYRTVITALGIADEAKTVELATARLELLAGHAPTAPLTLSL